MFTARKPEVTSEAVQGLPGAFVELTAGVTHYELQGDANGPTVVLIHGNAAPYVTWDHTIGALAAAGFRVLRYDVFGHGFSARPKRRSYDRHFYNVQLADLLDRLDIPDPVSLVGTSQGGTIGACFAAAHPGKVNKLALLAPFFDDAVGSQALAVRLIKAPLLGELLMRLMGDAKLADLSNAVVNPDIRAALGRDVAQQFRFEGKRRAMLANLRGDGLRDATVCYQGVKEQHIPVLLTWGTADQKIGGDSMRRLSDLMPHIEFHELHNAGHLAHYEFPDDINPILVRFLTQ